MLEKDVTVEELFTIAIKRYKEERPQVKVTQNMMDRIYCSIEGKLNHEGKEAAYEYVRTAKLLDQ